MKKTWSMILKVIIAVAGAIAGVIGVQAATMKNPACFAFIQIIVNHFSITS